MINNSMKNSEKIAEEQSKNHDLGKNSQNFMTIENNINITASTGTTTIRNN
jgi:hypothetical protein